MIEFGKCQCIGGDKVRTDILGVGFDSVSLDQSIEYAMNIIDRHEGGYVVTPNPEIVWMSRKDAQMKQALACADLVLPDGVGILYGANILGKPLKDKVTGVDFGLAVTRRLSENRGSVYLLGSKPGVAQAAAAEFQRNYPGIEIAGTHHGYFDDDDEIIGEINSAKPDFLMVCLGSPRQEKWMLENSHKLDVGLMAGLGGTMDVLSGHVKRAPENWQRRNMEWLYRLIKEPKRIKRQIKIPLFMLSVIGERIVGGKQE